MTPRKPNILWICSDQQRFDTVNALGNPHIHTPHLDRLVERGVSFERAYAQSPVCTPSRASFLTGRYPSSVKVNRNGIPSFPSDAVLVTRLLADAGYDCGLIGKLHLASAYKRVEPRADDGYSYWRYSHAPRDDWPTGHDYADWVRERGHDLDELRLGSEGIPSELHQTNWCADRTIEFIRQRRSAPWLASVNFYDPHPPFDPPTKYSDMYDATALPGPAFRESDLSEQARLAGVDFQGRARPPHALDLKDPLATDDGPGAAPGAQDLKAAYYAMITFIDEQIGRIFAALEESGELDDTLVIFMSDHGEMLGDHGLVQKGCRFYEGLVRVPLIVSWPRQLRRDVRSEALVELVDLAPTLLDLTRSPVPDSMQGRSLAPILRGVVPPQTHRTSVRCEYYDALDLPGASMGTMWCNGRYKVVVYHGHDHGELYDLQDDPNEFVNLWAVPSAQSLKCDLVRQSFDASVSSLDLGAARIGPM
ncbi:MAG: sulfatase-like hydrolase/transferase [Trueperaceae bacterium]